jgi:hypothetical protein
VIDKRAKGVVVGAGASHNPPGFTDPGALWITRRTADLRRAA